jgi:hypothetical protein
MATSAEMRDALDFFSGDIYILASEERQFLRLRNNRFYQRQIAIMLNGGSQSTIPMYLLLSAQMIRIIDPARSKFGNGQQDIFDQLWMNGSPRLRVTGLKTM